ncbi:hypothetical protein EC957_001573 [Mortierella hygrophila]|uniref:Uncharacterized protein n=1 Tax=Mortierella hygrophila TaxID=979708 RepID=A0A9P6FFI0_9FUNG|nr:hypothetical protein EC957_001573 [Mortierella hygrophila]
MNCDRLYHRDLAWDWAWRPTKPEKTLTKRQSISRLYCYGSSYSDEDLNDILLPVDMTSQFRLPATLASLKIAVELRPRTTLLTPKLVIKNTKLRQFSLEDLLTPTQICSNSSFSAWRGATLTHIEVMEEHLVCRKTIDVCPKASEWSLPAEVTPGLTQEMVFLPNIITTLEIVAEGAWCQGLNSKDAYSSKAGRHLIHQHLFESPQHVHHKIIRGAIIFEFLDLYNRAQYEDLNLRGNRK